MKQGAKVGTPNIDAPLVAMCGVKCDVAFLVSFDYASNAPRETGRLFREDHRILKPLTVREILNEEIPRELV